MTLPQPLYRPESTSQGRYPSSHLENDSRKRHHIWLVLGGAILVLLTHAMSRSASEDRLDLGAPNNAPAVEIQEPLAKRPD